MKEKQNFGLKLFLFFLLKIHLKCKFCFIVVRNLRELFFKYLLFAKSFPSIHKLFFKFLPNFLRYTRYRYLLQSLIYRSILAKFLIKWPKTTIINNFRIIKVSKTSIEGNGQLLKKQTYREIEILIFVGKKNDNVGWPQQLSRLFERCKNARKAVV